jgi:hypothetical protein
MGIIIPPPPPIVPSAANPQPRPELVIMAPQRPIAAQTTRAVTAPSKGREGNKTADSDTQRAEDEATQLESGGQPSTPASGAQAQPKTRGGKVSIDI